MSTPALKDWPLWEVFVRSKQGLDHKHCGNTDANKKGDKACKYCGYRKILEKLLHNPLLCNLLIG